MYKKNLHRVYIFLNVLFIVQENEELDELLQNYVSSIRSRPLTNVLNQFGMPETVLRIRMRKRRKKV